MEKNTKQQGNIIAIITMMFLFAMISFVTNLAAPIGVIWKNVFNGTGSENMIGMLGNAMNFLAYLFMGKTIKDRRLEEVALGAEEQK